MKSKSKHKKRSFSWVFVFQNQNTKMDKKFLMAEIKNKKVITGGVTWKWLEVSEVGIHDHRDLNVVRTHDRCFV